jgi:hypothetical protein
MDCGRGIGQVGIARGSRRISAARIMLNSVASSPSPLAAWPSDSYEHHTPRKYLDAVRSVTVQEAGKRPGPIFYQ